MRLGALTACVTPELVDDVLAECGRGGVRPGALSPRFMVYFTLALALFAQDSYDDVAENLVGALEGMDETIPNRASFTRARQRLGPEVLEAVFRRVRGPLAPAQVGRAFWRGMRLAAVDGFVLDLPDNKANREFFGGWSDARGAPAGFPQVRVVTLTETGTHASIDARIGGFNGGERELAVQMACSAAGMLVIMDRNFPGVELWKEYTRAGAHLLLRARSTVASPPLEVLADGSYLGRMSLAGQRASHPGGVTVRVVEYRVDGGEVIKLLTDLLDVDAYPAAELAALYHDRWEVESAYRQVKTFQRGPAQVLRSATPALVHQEVWAHLVVHHCLNGIIMQVADGERIDPHRISFVKVLKHVRRSVIRQAKDGVAAVGAFLAMLEAKVHRKLDTGPRRNRSAPRVLKRPDSKYSPSVKKQQHGPTRRVPAKMITLSPAMLQ
ncbi:IS4 family transposase [Streptomyces sp. NBC_00212]|uniref:IS4 family transposase n=1 Tax=Streptomyces sp. NBC_00212 TaxID=2975684 RepID=UPI0038632E01